MSLLMTGYESARNVFGTLGLQGVNIQRFYLGIISKFSQILHSSKNCRCCQNTNRMKKGKDYIAESASALSPQRQVSKKKIA